MNPNISNNARELTPLLADIARRQHKNKKAVARIIESFIAVMMVMSVILIVLARQPQFENVAEQELTQVQRHILDQVKEDVSLRNQVLSGNLEDIKIIIGALLPPSYSFKVRACPLNQICSLGFQIDEEVYVEEAVIAADLTKYDPTLLKLFFWEGGYPDEYCEDTCLSEGATGCMGIEGYRTCEKNDNGCLGWSEKITECGTGEVCSGGACVEEPEEPECTTNADCSDGKVCEGGSCVAPTEAELSLTFSNVEYSKEGIYHYYYHKRTFRETNGVGVTLTSSQICYLNGECDTSPPLNYRINANNELVHTNKQFHTSYGSDKFTLKYWGNDDNGNSVYIEQIMIVSGSSHTP